MQQQKKKKNSGDFGELWSYHLEPGNPVLGASHPGSAQEPFKYPFAREGQVLFKSYLFLSLCFLPQWITISRIPGIVKKGEGGLDL